MARPPFLSQYGAVFHICGTFYADYAENMESSVGGTVENEFLLMLF